MSTLGLALVLVLRTYDLVGVPPREFATAARAAGAVLRQARIELSWIACPAGAAAVRDPRCDATHQPSDLMLRILAAPALPGSQALGEATVDTGAATGSLATVYLHRIRVLAAASGVDSGILMGRAIAHEIGHLLAGTSSHSASGLMRAHWTPLALRRDNPWAWTFSDREAAQLRTRLSERLSPAVVTQAGVIQPFPPSQPCPKLAPFACAGR